jgi:hypothetical protein
MMADGDWEEASLTKFPTFFPMRNFPRLSLGLSGGAAASNLSMLS